MLVQFTWFLGILSIVQMAFLPGFILCRGFKVEEYFPSKLALYFFTSLLANYALVYLLASMHLYTSFILHIVVGIESAMVLYMTWPNLLNKPHYNPDFHLLKIYWQKHICSKWIISLALAVLLFYSWELMINQGEVFMRWDPMVSYNPWAIEWAANHFPVKTWDYPQLLSTNWSLSYVMIGNLNGGLALEFFPRSIMGLFPLFLMWSLWLKMLEEQSDYYGLSVIVMGLLLDATLWSYIGHGYADIPMMTMSFAAVLILVEASAKPYSIKPIVLGSCLCAAAALTKQAGLWLALVYPVLSYGLLIRQKALLVHQIARIVLLQIMIISILVLSWYSLVWWGGLHKPLEWKFLTYSVYHGASWMGRLKWAYKQVGAFFCLSVLVACFGLKWNSPWRLPFSLIALPMLLIWLIAYSYDDRNIAIILPFISLMMAIVLARLCKYSCVQSFLIHRSGEFSNLFYQPIAQGIHFFQWAIVKYNKVFQALPIIAWWLILTSLMVAIGYFPGLNARDLNAYQIEAKQAVAEPELYGMLYSYQTQHGFQGSILTPWGFLFTDVPALAQHFQTIGPEFYGPDMLPAITRDKALFIKALHAYSTVKYVLVDNNLQLSSFAFHDYLASMQKLGKVLVVGQTAKFTLYEIIGPLQ